MAAKRSRCKRRKAPIEFDATFHIIEVELSLKFQFLVCTILTALMFASVAGAGSGTPVQVGGEDDLDACGGVGKVVGLNPAGDNFLAVRSGPGSRFRMIDKLHTDQLYFDCDSQGDWVGIVYSRNPNADCGVGTPIPRRQAYRGPCKSGWVFRKYTKLIAG